MWQEGVMGGGGDDWYNVILLTATAGVTVNITDGDEDIDIVGTGLQQAVTIHDENATYTISANENGLLKSASNVTTDSTSGKLFTRELKMAAIEVTFDDDFRGQSFTISDGTTTSTAQTFPATGNTVDIFVPSTGTWTISSSVSGDPYTSRGAVVTNLDGTYTDEIHVIPVGATVLPVNDIQLWLECAAIRNKPYTKLEEVLADEITLIKLMSDSNAVDYLKRSTEWIGGCDPLVPAMDSETTPSGRATASAAKSAYEGYTAFNESNANGWYITSAAFTNEWLKYEFPSAKVVGGMMFKNTAGSGTITVELQASNDDTWTNPDILLSDYVADVSTTGIVTFNNTTAYKYYRIFVKASTLNTNSSGLKCQLYSPTAIVDNELAMQAIGAYDYAVTALISDSNWLTPILNSEYADEVFNIEVPLMTDNTHPKGEAIAIDSGYNSHPPYYAFDGDDAVSSRYISSSTASNGCYIGYTFDEPVEITKVKAVTLSNVSGYSNQTTLQVEYLDPSDNQWKQTGSAITQNIAAEEYLPWEGNTFIFDDVNAMASSFRVMRTQGQDKFQMITLQFYGREAGGVQSWLKAAGISKPYTTLDEVIADSDALATLVTNHAAVDYLVTAKGLIEGITSSAKAMRYIGYRNYCADTLLADADWAVSIYASDYKSYVVNKEVPNMTSATAPEGEVTRSSIYSAGGTNFDAWKAFNSSGYGWVPESTDTTPWIQYEFVDPVMLNNVKTIGVDGSTAITYHCTVLASNDNFATPGEVLGTIDVGFPSITTRKAINSDTKYKYYRLRLDSSTSGNFTVAHGVKVQFYGREDVDETKITVIGATNADIYYKSGNTDVPIDTLSGNSKAIDRTAFPTPAGTHRLYSTIANDPDNLSNDYYKDVNITSDTVEIMMMPEDALYWYGYLDDIIQNLSTANGWSVQSVSFGTPNYDTNKIDITAGGSTVIGVGTKDKVELRSGHTIIQTSDLEQTDTLLTISKDRLNNSRIFTSVPKVTNTKQHTIGKAEKQKNYLSVWNFRGNYGATTCYLYGLYKNNHNPLANFFSAANDTVYYTVGGTDIVVAETNDLGEAIVDLSSIPSGVILYSSVAKDPDNLSNDYTKLFIPPLTERFYFMPDNALYWYGWISDECEVVSTDNGWSLSGFTTVVPNFEEDDAVLNPGASNKLSGLGFKVAAKGKGKLNLVYQGVTAYSGDYGSMYSCASKAITTSIYTTLTSSSVTKTSLDFDANTYNLVMAGHTRKANIDSLWYDSHDTKSNFFSAANDRVYYLDGATPVYVAETNAMGEAWLDLSKIPNGVTLYSSVAKDPDDPNLTDPFSKAFSVGSDGKFYLMPDNTLYWWGYKDDVLGSDATMVGQTFVAPDEHTNYISFAANSSQANVLNTKVPMRNVSTTRAIVGDVSGSVNGLGAASSKTGIGGSGVNLDYNYYNQGSALAIQHCNVTNAPQDRYLCTWTNTQSGMLFKLYAFWYE